MECDVIPASSATADAAITTTTTTTTTNNSNSSIPIDPFELKDPLGNLDSNDYDEEPGGFALNAVMIDSEAPPTVTLVGRAPMLTSTHHSHAAQAATPTAAKSSAPTVATRRKQNKAPAANTSPTCKAKKTTAKSAATTTTTTSATSVTQASTMREVLASIPGFSLKPRRRTTKKMSTAAQIAQTREGCIDLETPDSILCGANLRSLLNKHTFALLPPLFQYKLVQLLPAVDRPSASTASTSTPSSMTSTTTDATTGDEVPPIRLAASSLNNEFFSRACLEWRERLSEGEFTPENQMKIRADAEKEKSRLDPWKLKHFEPIWGRDRGEKERLLLVEQQQQQQQSQSPVKTETTANAVPATELDAKSEIVSSPPPPAPPKQSPRTVRALTRSSIVAAAASQQNNLTVPEPIATGSATATSSADAAPIVAVPTATQSTTQSNAIVASVTASAVTTTASIAATSSSHHNHTSSPSKTPVPELLPIRVAKPAQQRPTPAPSSVTSFAPAATASRDRVDAAKPSTSVKLRATPPPPPTSSSSSSSSSSADIIVISDSGDDQSCPSTTTTAVLTTSAVSSSELTVTISSNSSGSNHHNIVKPLPMGNASASCLPTKPSMSVSKAVVTTTASYTIPSGIEVIPLPGGHSDTASGGVSAAKRHANKRSTPGSPDARNHIKISKYSHHPLQQQQQQHHHNHHHHSENSISSGTITSAGVSNKHNGIGSDRATGAQTSSASASVSSPSCAISDVIQIIKLPESTCPLPTQSPIGMAEAPVPSISVAVTTISVATAQASSTHHRHHHPQQQQQHNQQQLRPNHALHLPSKRGAASTIQIIDTSMRTKQTPTVQATLPPSSSSSSRAAVHTKPSVVRITPAMLSPPLSAANVPKARAGSSTNSSHHVASPPHEADSNAIAIVDMIDSSLDSTAATQHRPAHPTLTTATTATTTTTTEDDAGGSGFAETPADHVFRAMVCRGDDVLCGDGRVVVPQVAQPQQQPQPPQPQSVAGADQVEPVAEMFPQAGDALVYEFEMGCDVDVVPAAADGPNNGDGDERRCDTAEATASAAVAVAAVPPAVDVVAELEPSIQVLDPMVAELDPIEQEFTDAENYVLESGEISADSSAFERATSNNRIDPSSAPESASCSGTLHSTDHPTTATAEVIPMQETLEVRVKESITYPAHRNWPYKPMDQHAMQQPGTAHHSHSPHPHRLMQQSTTDSAGTAVTEHVFDPATGGDPAKSPVDHDECAPNHGGEAPHAIVGANLSSMVILSQPNFESTSQVKLELEVTLTPESEVSSSTIAAHASYHGVGAFADGDTSTGVDQQQRMQAAANRIANVSTIIPPTTIVCLPNPAPAPIGDAAASSAQSNASPTSHTTYMNAMLHGSGGGGKPNSVAMMLPHHRFASTGSMSSSSSSSSNSNSSNSSPSSRSSASSSPAPVIYTNNHVQRPPVSLSLPPPASGSPSATGATSTSTVWPSQQQQVHQQHHTTVASSSSLPYLSLATTQPMRAVPQPTVRARAPFATASQAAVVSMAASVAAAKNVASSGRGNRGGSNRPPPGAVNLERSYQICQAVIQNSPNRHQLKAQLRPPPSMLATPATTATATATSTGATVAAVTTVQSVAPAGTLPRREDGVLKSVSNIAQKRASIVHRQNSTGALQPSVRHVFTTNQGIPVSMTVLPSGMSAHHHPMHLEQYQKHSIKQQHHPHQMMPQHLHPQQQQHQQQVIYSMAGGDAMHPQQSQHQLQPQSMHGTDGGQYILVQNSGSGTTTTTTAAMLAQDEFQTPRSSSAPPAQNAHQQLHTNNSAMSTTVSLPASSSASTNGSSGMRLGRPASLDTMDDGDVENMDTSEHHMPESYFEPQKTIRPSNHSKGHYQQTVATGYMQHTTTDDPNAAAGTADHPHPSTTHQYPSPTSAAAPAPATNAHNAHLVHHQYSQNATTATAVVRMDSTAGGNVTPPNCSCSMNAMVICQQCGIFCHDECTGSTKLCLSCVIR